MAVLPCGVHFSAYKEAKSFLHTPYQWTSLIILFIFLLLLPFILPAKLVSMMSIMAILLVVVLGLQITTGLSGQINLGQSAFMGMGAFATASLAINFHLPFWLSIPGGGLAAALLGIIFGMPALRVKGFYLALTTMAAQVLFPLLILNLPSSWFGSSMGLGLEPAKIGSYVIQSRTGLYFLVMGGAVIMSFFAFNLTRSRTGRALVALRDNDIVAEIMGVNLFYYKTLAFAIGAMFAGIGGGLWAYYLRFVMVDQFTLWNSIWYVGMVIVGGTGSILGAIFGTFAIHGLEELLVTLGPWLSEAFPNLGGTAWFTGMNVVLGGVIILFLIFEPKGLAHRWSVIKHSFRIWPYPYL